MTPELREAVERLAKILEHNATGHLILSRDNAIDRAQAILAALRPHEGGEAAVAWRWRQLHHEIDGPITGWGYADAVPTLSDHHRWEVQPLFPAPPSHGGEVKRESAARIIASNPAYLAEVRDEQQTWLAMSLAVVERLQGDRHV